MAEMAEHVGYERGEVRSVSTFSGRLVSGFVE
jgi:hypothetical protein